MLNFNKCVLRLFLLASFYIILSNASAGAQDDVHKAMMWNLQGEQLYMNGQYNEAVTAFTNAINMASTTFAYAYNGRAVAYEKLGQYDVALANYNAALQIDDMYADAYINRGRLLRKHYGKIDQAAADFKEATELKPKSPAGFYFLGTIYEYNKNYAEAERLYDEAIKNDAHFFKAYLGKGTCQLRSRKYKEAAFNYSRYFVESQRPVEYKTLQEFIYKATEVEQSEAYIGQALAYESAAFDFDPKALDSYGFSVDAADKAISLDNGKALAYSAKGLALYALHHHEEEAGANFQQALALDANVYFADYGLGRLTYDAGDYRKAIVFFNNAVKNRDDFAAANFYKGRSLDNLGDYASAIAEYNVVIKAYPNDKRAYFYRGADYQSLGRTQEALSDFNKVVQLDNTYAPVYYALATYYETGGNNQEALANYKKYLQFVDQFQIDNTRVEFVKSKITELGGSI